MKRGRRILLIVVACAVAGLVVALVWPREREPVYQGKRLSEWTGIYGIPIAPIARGGSVGYDMATARRMGEAENAVRQIGTNGLPFLLEWIKCDTPKWKNVLFSRYAKIPARFRSALVTKWLDGTREQERGLSGLVGLLVLGAAGSPAIPELRRLASGAAGPNGGFRAAQALAGVGDEGKRAILDLVRNPGTPDRVGLILQLEIMQVAVGNVDATVEALGVCLRDKDKRVRFVSLQVLCDSMLNGEAAVSALIAGMGDDWSAVRAASASKLGSFGAEARRAVPKLMDARRDPDWSVREAATNAVRQIAPEVLEGIEQRQIHVEKSETNPSP